VDHFPHKENMLICSLICRSFRYGPGDYQLAIDLITSGSVNVKELITGRVKFEDAEQAFEQVHAGKGIKMIIENPQ
jgi:D-xylulose reductase